MRVERKRSNFSLTPKNVVFSISANPYLWPREESNEENDAKNDNKDKLKKLYKTN